MLLLFFSNHKYTFVAADVADFEAEGRVVGADGAVPETGGFLAVLNYISEAVYLDFGVAVPWGVLVGCGAVNGKPFDSFQTFLTDKDGLKLFPFG